MHLEYKPNLLIIYLFLNFTQEFFDMDKRSFLFVFAFSIALFFVNVYFSDQRAEEHRKWLAEKEAYEARQAEIEEKKVIENQDSAINQEAPERFYVLENDYQQLVFTNVGGSLVEINLPFQTKNHPNSSVKQIEFDRQIVKESPENALFPLHPYDKGTEKDIEPQEGGYYPLIRRSLTGKSEIPPSFYALNIVSNFPDFATKKYAIASFDSEHISFVLKQKHRTITKTFRLTKETAPYIFDLEIKVDGDSQGLWLTSGLPEVEWISGMSQPTLKYRVTKPKGSEVSVMTLPKDSITVGSMRPDWVCNSNGFLGLILDPLTPIDPGYKIDKVEGNEALSRLALLGGNHDLYPAKKMPGYNLQIPLPQGGKTSSFRIFAGPFSEPVLQEIDTHFSNDDYTPDYHSAISYHGWFSFISGPFAKLLYFFMKIFHKLTHSWALSIILVTVLLRLMLYPLNAWSLKSMRKMQKISPMIQEIQNKHKKNPQQAQLEILNLYRTEKVNPLSGCFPILIQMPFLIGMFDLLKSSFELRGASFIPGWIDNLSAPDVLFTWDYPLFLIGNEFHLLPVLLGAVMYLQSKLNTTRPKDPSQMTEQQQQQAFMGNMMTVVFTVMFYNFPSGLNLYWLSSMGLGIIQQWFINKQVDGEGLTLEVNPTSVTDVSTLAGKKQGRKSK